MVAGRTFGDASIVETSSSLMIETQEVNEAEKSVRVCEGHRGEQELYPHHMLHTAQSRLQISRILINYFFERRVQRTGGDKIHTARRVKE